MFSLQVPPVFHYFLRTLWLVSIAGYAASSLAQSTWIGSSNSYNTAAFFNETTGILTIPDLEIFTVDGLGESKTARVTLEQSGSEHFVVRNYQEMRQPPSCSESEIIAATQQIDLSTSFEEASAMFSCSPIISQAGVADFESGKLVFVNWIAGSGTIRQSGVVVTSYTPFSVTSSSTWLPASAVPGYLNSPSGTPAISLAFREGVLEVISYVTRSQNTQQLCDSARMASLVETLQTGNSLDAVNESLGCNGSLISTRIDAAGKQEYYNWVGQPPVFSQTPNIQPPDFYTFVSLQGRFSENGATGFDGTITRQQLTNSECTIEGLTTAAENFSTGMSETRIEEFIDCNYSTSRTSFSTDSPSTVRYQWQTSVPVNSPLLSLNRRLIIVVVDGSIESVTLQRT